MGKRKDEYFWTHMKKRPEGVECKYCSSLFKGRPSISRMKSHLLGTPNQGISICDKIPHELRLELEEINKRHKFLPSSSNVVESLRLEPQSGEPVTGQRDRTVSGWTQDEQPASVHPGGSQPSEARATKGIKLLTTAFEGDALRSNLDKVWSWLMNSDIGGVGVYGMGGIGKTALAKHINNRLLRDPNPFLHVYWVGVSQHCSIKKLQNAIAGAIGLSLPSFENETLHAARLCEALVEKKKSVLILDDVWEFLDLERAGIPVGSNTYKLVVTSRTLSVYRLIGCRKIIKMQTLSKQQSWSLFLATLGGGTTLPIQVEEVAKSIVEQCEGLPLGIVTVAKCMRGVVDLREWRKISEELKGSMPRQQIVELFDSLKLSYNALREPMFKQVFMFCALLQKDLEHYPDYYVTALSSEQEMVANKQDVVDCLVANGLTGGLESGQIEFDAMHHSLNLLEDNALLIFEPFIKSHRLLKIMAILITKERGDAIIEIDNKKLENLPAEEKWTSALKDVLLVNTSISCIAPSHPPKCPRLSSLYANSRCLLSIDELFFQHLSGLIILDLSNTEIERLPYSVCMLGNLTSLVVSGCKRLNYVPPLSMLQALKKLDMSYCYDVQEVPGGMELLKDLNYLNLIGTGIVELPDGLLGSLSRLQDLKVSAYIKVEELAALKKLETLACCFRFHECSSTFANLTHSLRRRLDRYSLLIGDWNDEKFYDIPLSQYSVAYSDFGLVYERVVKFQETVEIDDTWSINLPRNIQCLIIHDAYSVWKSLVLQNGLCAAGLRC